MTADITPESLTTEQVRELYQNGTWNDGVGSHDTAAEFDRWLAAHDAEVWDQGALAEANRWIRKPVNPYRAEQIGEK